MPQISARKLFFWRSFGLNDSKIQIFLRRTSFWKEPDAGYFIRLSGEKMQTMYAIINGIQRSLKIPRATEFLLPGILWGAFDEILTPAFWLGQAWQHME